MDRGIIGLVSGTAVGGLIVGMVRTLALTRYPVSEGLSQEEVDIALSNMNDGFYFFVIASHILGALCAALIGTLIAKSNKRSWGLAAGLLILIFTAYSNFYNGNPHWAKALDISATAFAGYIGTRIPRS